MGLLNSKSFEDITGALPQTPTYKARPKKILALDPRSPSDDIVRTPIQVEQTPKSECSDAFLCGEDPRSPTAGLPRTPVAAPEKLCRKYGATGEDMKSKMFDTDNPAVDKIQKQLFQGKNNIEKSVLHASNSRSDIKKGEVGLERKQSFTVFDFPASDKENDPLLDHQK